MARRLRLHADTGDVVTARLRVPQSARDVGIVLAHGAGAGQDHPWMRTVADGLAAAGFPTMTFNYPYTEAGRSSPDRPARLLPVHRAAFERMTSYAGSVVLAGKSMGGRLASHLVGDEDEPAAALVYYAYPLVPMGRGEPRPSDHLARIAVPQLFFCGTRDRLSPPQLIEPLARSLPHATVVVVEEGDHSFKVPKRAGRTDAEVLATVVATTVEWLEGSVAH